MAGNRQRAEEVWEVLVNNSRRLSSMQSNLYLYEADSVKALLDGRIEEAIDISNQLRILGEEAGVQLI